MQFKIHTMKNKLKMTKEIYHENDNYIAIYLHNWLAETV